MSKNLIENEDYQIVTLSENGLFTAATLNTDLESNSGLLEDFQNVDNIPQLPFSIENEDYQIVTPSNNGLFTVSTLNTESLSNSGLLEDFQNVDTIPQLPFSTNSCFDGNNLPKIETLDSLLSHLCELMIRFDGCVKDYQKSDFEHLIKTVTNSLIYLYSNNTTNTGSFVVGFMGIANKDTNPYLETIAANNKYPGIYFAQEFGNYPHFGVDVTNNELFNSIVLLIPNINSSGTVLNYEKSIYNLQISNTSIIESDAAPLNPTNGMRWLDTTSGIKYEYTLNNWVELGPNPIEKKYGPYHGATLNECLSNALSNINQLFRYEGLTIGIKVGSDDLIEYWFSGGILDSNLKIKNAQSTFTKGDNLIVDNLNDLYNLYTRVNDLIENLSRVFVLSEQKSYLLININDFSDNAFNPSAWKLIEEGIYDAPIDNEIHGRRNGEWVPLDFAEKNHDHDIGNQILFFENSLI